MQSHKVKVRHSGNSKKQQEFPSAGNNKGGVLINEYKESDKCSVKKDAAICGCTKGGIFSRNEMKNTLKPFYKEQVKSKLEFCELYWSSVFK